MNLHEDRPEWGIGSIVALKSHPYFDTNDTDSIYISGEPQLISPLMVITEALKAKKTNIKSDTSQTNYSCQYKCMWYSDKTHQFEEVWINSELLKLIIIAAYDEEKEKNIAFGINVEFKTSNIELGKKKITLKQNSDNLNSKNYSVTAHLSYVSPILQVLSTNKNNQSKTKDNSSVRIYSKLLVKCKYYNINSNKFSEIQLPIETLDLVPNVSIEKIMKIKKAISDSNFLIIKDLSTLTKTIVSPKKINVRNNRYYLSAYDYIENIDLQKNINELEIAGISKTYFKEHLPFFDFQAGKLNLTIINKTAVEDLIKKIGVKKYIQISYIGHNEVKSSRTISAYEIVESNHKEINEKDALTDIVYLKAFCHLRNAERYFRIDRINKLKVLDLIL